MPSAALSLVQPRWTAADTPPDQPPPARSAAKIHAVSEIDELVARCQAGEPAAFHELFRTHRSDVARLVHRMLGPSPDLEDVIQEVFLQVHKSIRDFRGQARISTWLYRVTVNVVLMHRRAARSRPVFIELPETHPACDASPLPDEQVARRARIRAFNRLLDRLSEKKRAVFILHELEGMAPVEIAKIVEAPVLTVRTRLFYARRELAEMLRDEPALASLADELVAPSADPDERADARAAGRERT